ncbi:MAG TPA: hypothetical protein VFY36_07935 [Solirubrobacteraceae bacterium]|nr:hypothetical protein [Solirubrobacteraceae bacterium]
MALVVACFAAFFVTQRLKHTPTAVQKFKLAGRFSPYAPAGHNQESISFKLERAQGVTVTIVNAAGNTVATLFVDHPVARYKQFSFRWNGRRGSAHGYRLLESPHGRSILVPKIHGPVAPPGEYRVEVSLIEQGHTVSSPHSFTLVGRR